MRHCLFTRMLYCPARSPLNFSSQFDGGTRNESICVAAAIISSFRAATRCTSRDHRREYRPSNSASVCRHRNDLITSNTNAPRQCRQALLSVPPSGDRRSCPGVNGGGPRVDVGVPRIDVGVPRIDVGVPRVARPRARVKAKACTARQSRQQHEHKSHHRLILLQAARRMADAAAHWVDRVLPARGSATGNGCCLCPIRCDGCLPVTVSFAQQPRGYCCGGCSCCSGGRLGAWGSPMASQAR